MNECMLSPGHNGIHSLQIKHKSLSFRNLQVTKEDINMNTGYENKDVSQVKEVQRELPLTGRITDSFWEEVILSVTTDE